MTEITRKRGDTYPIDIAVTRDGVALDITGCTFVLTVDPSKAPLDDTANLFQLAGVIVNGSAGTVSFTPTAGDTDHVGKFFYDVQMTDTSGAIRTIAADKFTLVQDITKL
jgi:hypothetical protein